MFFPIQVYTKEGCTHCGTVKAELKARNIAFLEYEVGKDVTREWFKENYPGVKMLPAIVTETEVYAGPNEVQKMLDEYGGEAGKQLLNEDNADFAM